MDRCALSRQPFHGGGGVTRSWHRGLGVQEALLQGTLSAHAGQDKEFYRLDCALLATYVREYTRRQKRKQRKGARSQPVTCHVIRRAVSALFRSDIDRGKSVKGIIINHHPPPLQPHTHAPASSPDCRNITTQNLLVSVIFALTHSLVHCKYVVSHRKILVLSHVRF